MRAMDMTAGALGRMSLNGTWELFWNDSERGVRTEALSRGVPGRGALEARVPGEAHLDLMRAGLIGDPAEGLHALAARWVEEQFWTYRRTFEAPGEAARAGARAWLVFEEVDCAASVFLNGEKVAEHANFFLPLRVDVTGRLRVGENVLVVEIESGLMHAGDKPGSDYHPAPAVRLHKRPWIRKPQCQFAWDWAPRLLNVGLSGSVALEWTAAAVRADQLVPLVSVAPSLDSAEVRVRWFVENPGPEPVTGTLRVGMGELGARAEAAVVMAPGLHPVEAVLEVKNPPLWWPRGHGGQPLVEVAAEIEVGGAVVARVTRRVGFRRVVVRQDAHEAGDYFYFEINNRPIFCKGGNLVPADLILVRADRERYAGLLARAEEMNFNFLRVWGGGLYEKDALYDLADERGFMVWQDMVFACAKYPVADRAFYQSVCAEVEHHARRLAAHPSLVAWCGNNELETANWHWNYEKWGLVNPDHAFFHITAPRILQREDPTRFYWPSSPYSKGFVSPGADHTGDQHPWGIGFHNTDFRGYRRMICSFPNEGGTLGPAALGTVEACLPEGQRRAHSFAWNQHDNSVSFWAEPSPSDGMIAQWTGREVAGMGVEEYVYWAGLVHGEGLREYIENFRRRMFRSGSAIFWMFNDTWPCVRSWTPVDYYLRRTPAFHPVRRAFAPVTVVVAEEGDEIVVFGVNETREAVRGRLRHGLFGTRGGYPLDRSLEVELGPNASAPLARFPLAEMGDGRGRVAFAVLEDGAGRVMARGRLVLPFFRELDWAKPEVEVRVERGEAVFESPVFVWGVCLDLGGEARLPDNFFDLYPGQPVRLPWAGMGAPRILGTGNGAPA